MEGMGCARKMYDKCLTTLSLARFITFSFQKRYCGIPGRIQRRGNPIWMTFRPFFQLVERLYSFMADLHQLRLTFAQRARFDCARRRSLPQ